METELRRMLLVVKKLWWIPVLLGIILAPITWYGGKQLGSTYVASTQLMIIQSVNGGNSVIGDATQGKTYLQFVESGPVLDRVLLEFGLSMSRFELARKIEARMLPGTSIIEIQVRDSDPQMAADLTNAIARHVESQISDLSLGQLQDNLDNLTRNVDTLKDRLVVVNSRIDELKNADNRKDPVVKAELASLTEERMQLQQSIADLDSTIRSINSELQTSMVPVVIIDSAQAPSAPQNTSAVIFGALGFMLGVLSGGCIIVYRIYRDHSINDARQLELVTSKPTLASMARTDVESPVAVKSVLLMTRTRSILNRSGHDGILLVTARQNDVNPNMLSAIESQVDAAGIKAVPAFGVLEDVNAIKNLSQASAAILLAGKGTTTSEDITRIVEIFGDLGIRSLGSVLVSPN